jgi:hypothetical protein
MDKKTMTVTNENNLWIAVRIQRGFVTQVKAYIDEGPARRQEKRWRRIMNPDYDETAVSRVRIIKSKKAKITHKSSPQPLTRRNVRKRSSRELL